MNGVIAVLVSIAFASSAAHPPAAREADCSKVKAQIRKVESRMRAGYTRAQGERLEARLRKLRKERSRVCR